MATTRQKKPKPMLRKGAITALAILLLNAACAHGASSQLPVIAIIIDDMGHNYKAGYELASLPYPLTLSFLPGRKFSKPLAEYAQEQNKEIMLHVPMENTQGIALGFGALTQDMTEQAFKSSLSKSLESVPHIVGINNHTGSLLTTRPEAMRWVMETLKDTPYYFVDSRTSARSVAANMASAYGIPSLKRDIFLDHEQSRSFLRKQFLKLVEKARKYGSAIAIGHPHQVTINFLKERLVELDSEGVGLATASAIWQIKHPQRGAKATSKANQIAFRSLRRPSVHFPPNSSP